MKKIVIINILALFVASAAFALSCGNMTTVDLSNSSTNIGGTIYGSITACPSSSSAAGVSQLGKLSTKVGVGFEYDATLGSYYVLWTQHAQGTKAYGTSFDSSALYWTNALIGTAVTYPSGTNSSAFVSAGWSTL